MAEISFEKIPTSIKQPGILLIRPRELSGVIEFSLGMGYIGRAILNAGMSVNVVCRDLHDYSEAAFREILIESKADVFAIGGMYGSFPDIIDICREIRTVCPATPIVLGGALATASPEHALRKTGADIACIGPAEETVVDLVKVLTGGGDVSRISGICFRQEGSLRRTAEREQPRFLGGGPSTWPAWELFDGVAYTHGTTYYPFDPDDVSAPIMTARGCPYACNFCF
ncbi:MAG: B12-binding domain-containing radical SAM protein, partial [Alphaproteobacteria bacterium]